MIKGIYFEERPWMYKVSLEEVLKNLNYLNEVSNKDVTDKSGYNINLKQYEGDLYKVRIYESDNLEGISAIYKMYSIISTSIPDFLTCYQLSQKKVIMAFSNFKSISEDQEVIMDFFIEEIIRVSVVVIKEFGEDNVMNMGKFLKDYVDTCTYCKKGYTDLGDNFLDDIFNV